MASGAQMEMERATATSIESLEQRVAQAVALIGELRTERDTLRSEIGAMHTQRDALQSEVKALQAERDALVSERGMIAQRIDDLVERLTELDSSS